MGKTQKTTSTSTTTPTNPSWVEPGLEGLFGQVTDLSKRDPNSFIAGTSPLQDLAFGQAPGLLGAGSEYGSMANAYGQRAADWQPAMVTANQAAAPGSLGVANASAVKASMDPAQMASASLSGPAKTYDASLMGTAAQADNPLLDTSRISALIGPYLQQVLGSTSANLDHSDAIARRTMNAKLAGTGAFGGSGGYLAPAELEAGLSRERGATMASTAQSGYTQALQAAMQELGLQNNTNLANASSRNQVGLADAASKNAAGAFNAGEQNQNARTDAGLGTQVSVNNSGLLGDLAKTNATLGTQTSLANAGAQNDANRLQYSTLADLASSNADRLNRAGETNASAWNAGADRALQAAGLFGDLATNTADSERKNAALVGDMGTQQRQVQAEQQMAPLSVLQQLIASQSNIPLNLLHGETTTGTQTSKTSNPMGALGTLAMLAAAPLTGGTSLLGSLGGIAGAVKAGAGLGTALKAGAGLASVGGFRAGLGR